MKSPPICIQIKLGPCRNMPTKTLYGLLDEVRRLCDKSRNAMFRHWQRWREDNPDWKPEQRRTRDGSLKVTDDGKPVLESAAWSQDLEKSMYACGISTAVKVAAKVVSACRSEVLDALKADVPYNHPGEARYRWQAILNYELSAPCYRDGTIPLPVQDCVLGYDGDFAGANKRGHAGGAGIAAEVKDKSESSAVLRFPLLSNASGFDTKGPIVALNIGELPPGKRRWIMMAARGEASLCDSELVYHDDGRGRGQWFAHLMIRPPLPKSGPETKRQAVLTPLPPGSSRPFEIRIPGDEPDKFVAFRMGDGKPYEAVYLQMDKRDRAIRDRSKGQKGSGHGRGAFYDVVRPIARDKRNEQKRFTNQLLADVMRVCLQNNCGTLLYREPTMPLRNELWFAARGLPFDWSVFQLRLKHKCQLNLIELAAGRKKSGEGCPRISLAEHREEYKAEWERKTA